MGTYLILRIFSIDRRIGRGRNFEEKWSIHAQRPTKPVFGRMLSTEGVDMLFHDADCVRTYAGSLFVDSIIRLG
jgi:hypothetical protein